jgi:hypothetical protein
MHETLVQNVGCAHYDFVGMEMLLPHFASPEITIHSSAETINAVVKVSLKNGKLLENKGYRRYL